MFGMLKETRPELFRHFLEALPQPLRDSIPEILGSVLGKPGVDLEKISQYYFLAFLLFEFILLFYITEKKMPSNEKK